MNQNPDTAPTVVSETNQKTDDTRRPRRLYLVALWCFMGIGGFLNVIMRQIAPNINLSEEIAALFVIIPIFALSIGVLKLFRSSLIMVAVLLGALAAFQIIALFAALLDGSFSGALVYVKLFYTIPSMLCAWYIGRPSFLQRAQRYRKFVAEKKKVDDQRKLQKHVQQKLSKGKF